MDDIPLPDPLMLQQWGAVPITCRLSATDLKDDLPVAAAATSPHFRQSIIAPSVPTLDTSRGGASVSGAFHAPTLVPTCSFIVPLQGYLFLHLDTVKENFCHRVKREESIWFSAEVRAANGVGFEDWVVPWHLPVTVILDLLAQRSHHTHLGDAVGALLPLQLTCHFTLPAAKKGTPNVDHALLRVKDLRTGAVMLYHRIKQSCAFRFGSADALYQMKHDEKEQYNNLFKGVKDNEPESFHVARHRLAYFGTVGNIGNVAADAEPKYAVAMHLNGKSYFCRISTSRRSFGTVLKELLPTYLEPLAREQCIANEMLPATMGTVAVQGVSPLLSTPIDFLVDVFSSCDLFLHIVFSPPTVRPSNK